MLLNKWELNIAQLSKYLQKLEINNKSLNYISLFRNPLILIRIAKSGISSQVLNEIMENSIFHKKEWAAFLHLKPVTLRKRIRDDHYVFNSLHSNRILNIIEVSLMGKEVFESEQNFLIWLKTESIALGNKTPITFLDSIFGIDLVKAELNSIEHGVFV
jgi:putative toxin-antitoxin system antitoxin component (TIGR02293 family)